MVTPSKYEERSTISNAAQNEPRQNQREDLIVEADYISIYSSETDREAGVLRYIPQTTPVGTFGEVNVQNSSDVHFGNKIFTAPITVVSADEEHVEKLGIKDVIQFIRKKFPLKTKNLSNKQLICITCIMLLLIYATAAAAVFVAISLSQISEIAAPELYINESWFLRREDWNALPVPEGRFLAPLKLPVKYALIGHTAGNFYTDREKCLRETRNMQVYLMTTQQMDDIAYNYLLCGNGDIIEGRGANKRGGHTKNMNHNSIIIALMGNYNDDSMTEEQIDHAQIMIQEFVKQGKIRKDYSLICVDQVAGMDSPGTNAKKIVRTWPHYEAHVDLSVD